MDYEKGIPEGYCALVMERSGLGIKQGIEIVARVIDAGYRGELFIGMCANSKMRKSSMDDFPIEIAPPLINPGDRIAQLVFVKHLSEIEEIAVEELTDTERGEAGIGSTGQ